jgi:RimJ/RimL family protein N-acetyltransferase
MLPVLHTARLVIRPVRPDDLEPLVERRNDPAVAELQAWVTPYPRERAEEVVTEVLAQEGQPVDGQWFMATVVEAATGEVVGDLVMHPTNELRTAEVGYSFSRKHWGKGYAAEALEAFVAWILEALPVTRVSAGLHPDNRASAMVLERTGLLYEGHTALSFWLDEDNSDDWIYGMTRADWEAWRDRLQHAPQDLRLVPVTRENKAAVLALRTHHSQRAFVAPMLDSFADALLPDLVDGAALEPWMRAIDSDGQPVGFVMVALTTQHHPEPYLWRLLIDRMHQRRGIGSRALALIADECRSMGDSTLLVSWAEGKGSPRPFYLTHGFEPTGRVVEGETEGRLQLT